MKCDRCAKESDGLKKKVYYAAILTKSTKSIKTGPTSGKTVETTTYHNIYDKEMLICKDCIKRKRLINRLTFPLKVLLFFSIFAAMTKEGTVVQTVVLAVAGALFLASVVITIINVINDPKKEITKADRFLYPLAKRTLKKQLRKRNPKAKYDFWSTYPKNVKRMRY